MSCAALSAATMVADVTTRTAAVNQSRPRHRLGGRRIPLARTLYGLASVVVAGLLALRLGVRMPVEWAVVIVSVCALGSGAAFAVRYVSGPGGGVSIGRRIGAGLPAAIGVWAGVCLLGTVVANLAPAVVDSGVLWALLLIALGLVGTCCLGRLGARPRAVAWLVVLGGLATAFASVAWLTSGPGAQAFIPVFACGLFLAACCALPPQTLQTVVDGIGGRVVAATLCVDLLLFVVALLVQSVDVRQLIWAATALIVITVPLPWSMRYEADARHRH